VKNILLVMADSGYLMRPPTQDPTKEKIWVETSKRLDRFLPDLFTDIFPPPSKSHEQPTVIAVQDANDTKATSNGNEPSEAHSESKASELTLTASSAGSDDVDE
jgi:brefeldin A-resistance guanine nucleotide exchange factor 1